MQPPVLFTYQTAPPPKQSAFVRLCARVCVCAHTDEGHGFARPPNRLDFASRVDQFLAKHLQGRSEPPLNMQDTSVVAMHEFKSLADYKPPRVEDSQPPSKHQQHKVPPAAVAAAAAAVAAGAAGAARAAGKGGNSGSLGQKIGLAVGIPTAVLAGAALIAVAVLRGLSPRR